MYVQYTKGVVQLLQESFFLHRVSIVIQALGILVLDEVDTLNYEGVSTMPLIPTLTPSHTFREITLHEIKFFQ